MEDQHDVWLYNRNLFVLNQQSRRERVEEEKIVILLRYRSDGFQSPFCYIENTHRTFYRFPSLCVERTGYKEDRDRKRGKGEAEMNTRFKKKKTYGKAGKK